MGGREGGKGNGEMKVEGGNGGEERAIKEYTHQPGGGSWASTAAGANARRASDTSLTAKKGRCYGGN